MTNLANVTAEPEERDTLTSNLHRLMRIRGVSEAELVRWANIPQATLHKVISGKTDDPRVSTLKALANAFEVSIDELLSGVDTPRKINIIPKTQSIPILSWRECIHAMKLIKNLTPANWNNWVVSEYVSSHAYGLISKASMEPYFSRKTVLIIDRDRIPEDGDIVVVSYPKTSDATLRKLSVDGPTKLLLPMNANGNPTKFKKGIKIIGVVLKSVFSFHK
jgi:SOS-response transcriptional repressor LexA